MKTIVVLLVTLIPAIFSEDAQKTEMKALPQQQMAAAAHPLPVQAEAKQSHMAKQEQPAGFRMNQPAGFPMNQPFMFGMPMPGAGGMPFPQPMQQPHPSDLDKARNKPARQQGADKGAANQARPQMNPDPMAAMWQQFGPQMQGPGMGFPFQHPFAPQFAYRY
ncbi:uncharacterized protein LOC129580724 [Paramacrobiotus metropolitanus]|uniref:uncharacterized protein LOC129580724 n=1 Tax=Paramacrobiotus metropolitanus TaxID=2943436 RepID=UPI0024457DEF|nr:uncharacterized protein LOC129580724 [Paramacrobiotus metropolitanus]